MPRAVLAGPCPMEGLTSLLRHLAQPRASSSHWGLIFICHWVICGGGTGLAARSSQHPYLAFTLPSPAVGQGCGRLLPILVHRWAPRLSTLSALPASSSACLAGFGAGEKKAVSHWLHPMCGGLPGLPAVLHRCPCAVLLAGLCRAAPVGPRAVPVTLRHPPAGWLQQRCPQAALGSSAPLSLHFLAGFEASPPKAGQHSQPPGIGTVGTQDQRAPCLHPSAQSQHQHFQAGLPLSPCTHLGLTSQTSANSVLISDLPPEGLSQSFGVLAYVLQYPFGAAKQL